MHPATLAGSGPEAQLLRSWRLKRARADRIPAFRVFQNRTLLAILCCRPFTGPGDLSRCWRIGPTRATEYGADLLRDLPFLTRAAPPQLRDLPSLARAASPQGRPALPPAPSTPTRSLLLKAAHSRASGRRNSRVEAVLQRLKDRASPSPPAERTV